MADQLISGAGAALVDLLIEESDGFLEKLGSEKGGMTLVELEKIKEAVKISSSEMKIVPGGSACNTLVGIDGRRKRARLLCRFEVLTFCLNDGFCTKRLPR